MAFPLLSCAMFYVMTRVDECLAPWETHEESWHSALSARPNDGIHLLFYGHSWSSVAPIWPKAHNLTQFSISLCLIPFAVLLNSVLCFSLSHFFFFFNLSCSPTCSQCLLFPPIFIHHSLTFPSLWLIALMFFLWSTATSSSSEVVWPHVFQEGMSRCGGEGPRGAHTAKHQNNMSHSCLMTSTIQPCRALTVHLHPEGSCNMKAIHLFHTEECSYFVIT